MNIKSLVLLIVFLLLGAATYFLSSAKQSINSSGSIGLPILPDLLETLNDIDELTIVGAGDQVMSTLSRNESGWVVKQRNQYPADISKIRASILSLAEAKIIEQKTSNADLYAKLGVEEVTNKDAQGIKVIVRLGDQVKELVVGNPGPQINKSRYARLANDDVSWLVDRKIDLKHEADYWLRKDILSVEPAEVSAVSIVLQDGSKLNISNSDEEENIFVVSNLSNPDSQVVDAELHQVTNALSSLQLLDVADNNKFADLEATMHIVYLLKNGVHIGLTAYELNAEHFVSLDVRVSQEVDSANKETGSAYVDKLQKATSGWIYKIPNVTYDSMYKREEDVLAITEDQLN